MEIKQLICLESEKNGATFRFICPVGSTWGASIDAAYEMLQELHKMSQKASESMQASQPEASGSAE